MKQLSACIMAFIAGSILLFAHPIHVSVCNIEISQKETIISIKLYSDDFGTIINNNFNADFNTSKADDNPNRDYIIKYINSNLQILLNKKKIIKFYYEYSEFNEESIWLYFKVNRLNMPEKIRIINTLMLDLFEDQTNLLIINFEGKQNGFRFNNSTRELDIELK